MQVDRWCRCCTLVIPEHVIVVRISFPLIVITGEFKREYPAAKVIAVEEAQKKVPEGLVFDGGASAS